jgi:hypothetical protein
MSSRPLPAADDEVPGCGLAAYAGILIVLGLFGAGTMLMSMLSIAFSNVEKGPAPLVPGNQTPVWAMSAMRKARLVRVDEVPLAFHDESAAGDGSVACALMDDRLVKVDGESGQTLMYAEVSGVRSEEAPRGGLVVVAEGPGAELRCAFRAGEGGDKMARQLQAEVDTAHGR